MNFAPSTFIAVRILNDVTCFRTVGSLAHRWIILFYEFCSQASDKTGRFSGSSIPSNDYVLKHSSRLTIVTSNACTTYSTMVSRGWLNCIRSINFWCAWDRLALSIKHQFKVNQISLSLCASLLCQPRNLGAMTHYEDVLVSSLDLSEAVASSIIVVFTQTAPLHSPTLRIFDSYPSLETCSQFLPDSSQIPVTENNQILLKSLLV